MRIAVILIVLLNCYAHAVAQVDSIERTYLRKLSLSFAGKGITHRASDLFWSKCLGAESQLTKLDLKKGILDLNGDSIARISFYKRFNYYLSSGRHYYTDILSLVEREQPMITIGELQLYAAHIWSFGQDSILEQRWNTKLEYKSDKDSTPVHVADSLAGIIDDVPIEPGGEKNMYEFLSKHIVYPTKDMEEGITGTEYVSFTVDKNGNIVNGKILRGFSRHADIETLRVIKLMSHIEPPKRNGEPLVIQYTIPVKFNLQ